MEIKDWTYEEYPEFGEVISGVEILKTSGDEIGVHGVHNVEYARINGSPLYLQLLLPFTRNEPKKIRPCVVFVQGSAWMDQESSIYGQLPMVSKLAARGYVTAIVQYRHSKIAPFPAQAKDARNAVRFMREHAVEYQIDPNKIMISGDSSGGHTAMFAGIIHDDDSTDNLYPGVSGEVKGIIDIYGSVSVMMEDGNPTTINHHLPDSPEGMVMGGVDLRERLDLREKLSVECNITAQTDIAPVLILHGTKDRTVNPRQSVNLYHYMKEVGKDVRFYLIQGGDHGGAEYWSDEVLDIEERFIQYCLNR